MFIESMLIKAGLCLQTGFSFYIDKEKGRLYYKHRSHSASLLEPSNLHGMKNLLSYLLISIMSIGVAGAQDSDHVINLKHPTQKKHQLLKVASGDTLNMITALYVVDNHPSVEIRVIYDLTSKEAEVFEYNIGPFNKILDLNQDKKEFICSMLQEFLAVRVMPGVVDKFSFYRNEGTYVNGVLVSGEYSRD